MTLGQIRRELKELREQIPELPVLFEICMRRPGDPPLPRENPDNYVTLIDMRHFDDGGEE